MPPNRTARSTTTLKPRLNKAIVPVAEPGLVTPEPFQSPGRLPRMHWFLRSSGCAAGSCPSPKSPRISGPPGNTNILLRRNHRPERPLGDGLDQNEKEDQTRLHPDDLNGPKSIFEVMGGVSTSGFPGFSLRFGGIPWVFRGKRRVSRGG
jgi:hypothetical protein